MVSEPDAYETLRSSPLNDLEEDCRLECTSTRSRPSGSPGTSQAKPLVSYKPILGMSAGFVITFLTAGLVSIALVSLFYNSDGELPQCRKSASLVVLPEARQGSNVTLELLIWSGMGPHKTPLSDLVSYDVAGRQWRSLTAELPPTSNAVAPLSQAAAPAVSSKKQRGPLPRWKAGTVQLQRGLALFGGDAFPPKGKHAYQQDLWLLDSGSLIWQMATITNSSQHQTGLPPARRAHTATVYRDSQGQEHLVVFGGRQHSQGLLNDAWEATLSWPHVSWRQVAPAQPHRDSAPRPRKGHIAVLLDDAPSPHILVFGGRDDEDYFDDLWLLDLQRGKWRRLQHTAGPSPAGRDHHSAAYFRGKMYIFGGRSGATYSTSRPLDDLWSFNLATLMWQRVPPSGMSPLPRFLNSFTQYAPAGSEGRDSRMVIFGGETLDGCKLNDVWELGLGSLMWVQLSPPRFCSNKCRRAFAARV